jgi:glycosyltransferase involved in cell wall biosynthesis
MITIVIPTKNEETALPRLLESIRRQTLQPAEIIVADAGSTDRTRDVAASYGARVVDGGLPGPGRNRGAEAANTDLLLFLDADVELRDPEFLERSVGEMLERRLDLATCDVFPLSDAWLDHVLHKAYNVYARAWGDVFPHAPGFCLFARRDLHRRIGGFDEAVLFCEDHDYAHRAAKLGSFGFLGSCKIPVSIRRLDRDGRVNIAAKYILAELHLAMLGPIRHDRFRYTFGHGKRKRPSERAEGRNSKFEGNTFT